LNASNGTRATGETPKARNDARGNRERFSQPVLIVNDEANSEAAPRFRAIGATASGRHAFIVFTLRRKRLRPLSARFMHRKEIDRYEKDNPNLQDR
jgi:uncharacterized DUF497 family protein